MDFEDAEMTITCPECEFFNTTTFKNVTSGGSLICIGCLKTIQLVDDAGSTKRALDDIRQSLNDLGRSFNGH